jgi:hypothetical protein
MKFLKLKFDSARLIREKSSKNMLGSNRFFYPINKLHIYNSICVLLDRTPKPQLRNTDDKYMPFYKDIMDVVEEGYVKINLLNSSEKITTVKKDYNSNALSADQYTWVDCDYVLGNLKPIFVHHVSEILSISKEDVQKISFEEVIEKIQSYSSMTDDIKTNKKGESKNIIIYTYTSEKILNLIKWLKINSATVIANYIENKGEGQRATQFGKRIYRGLVDSQVYSGLIYIPLTDALHEELITYSKGFSNILDGGLVKIIGYDYILEDDVFDFLEIKKLNSTRKFNEFMNTGVDWNNTVYKNLNPSNFKSETDNIISKCNISIENNKEYDSMFSKISKIKFNENIDYKEADKQYKKDIAYKINTFIENSINKQFK